MSNRIENIVIVGGGTAGWLSAAYLNRVLNKTGSHCMITLIESSDIGTIGVGEATLLTLRHTLEFMGFDEAEWMVRCNATFKMGIKYVNWSVGHDAYWIPFRSTFIQQFPLSEYWLKWRLQGTPEPFGKVIGSTVSLCEAQKSPKHGEHPDYQGAVEYAYNLDAGLLGAYLKEKAKASGVKHVVDNVVEVVQDENGFINHLVTEKSGILTGDLFIDCSGFKGLLINQTLQEPFISFSKALYCDRAVAINIPTDDSTQGINPYVTATALSAGWAWNIPVFGRSGNGYVYSSDFISPEVAEREFRNHLGESAKNLEARHIRMRIGHTRRAWVKNCVSIGLAGGFIEPLESTGIFLVETGLHHLVQNFPNKEFPISFSDSYNRIMTYYYEEIRDLIVLHYCTTRRTDTPFWQANRHHSAIPDSLKMKLNQARTRLPNKENFLYLGSFGENLSYAYSCILLGMDYLPDNSHPILAYEDDFATKQVFGIIQATTEQLMRNLPDHYEFLRRLHL
jgi:hypothetical protein